MKVLIVSKACVIGAYQKKMEELASFEDADLTVIVPPFWQEKGRRIELERAYTAGYELLVEELAFNGHFHLHFYPGLGAQVRRLKPDVMHIDEEPYNLATFQAMRLASSAGARSVFFTWQNLLRRYPFPFSWIEQYNYRHAAHAIAGNRDGVDVLRRKGYRGPVSVIPQFGVDIEVYRPSRDHSPGDPQPFRIGYAGRLVEEKGVDILLRAVAGMEGEWRVSILGDGPFRARLMELSGALGVRDRVSFELPLPSSAMPSHYRKLDVLVLPSRAQPNWKEQFGRVLIEAMACAVPVVGSDSGEIPHVIGDAGLLFPEDDVQALRGHLRALMADRGLRQSLAEKGREHVVQHYTQTKIAQETHEVYVEVLYGQRL
jgi:glycosyltransferase involved in cell wall biosynthesis